MVTAGMRADAARAAVRARLAAAGIEEAAQEADALLEKATGRSFWALERGAALSGAQAAQLEALAARREQHEPLQYLLGRWDFYTLTLAVGPGVLCPRADTETVVEACVPVLERAQAARGAPAGGQPSARLRLLDLCAGTGAIGLALQQKFPAAQVTLVEKSSAAFAYLQENARASAGAAALESGQVKAEQGDLFTYWQCLPAGELDLITCNPPYLTAEEMAHLQPETAREPAMALDGGADGLDFYRALAEHYQRALRPGGTLALEIGWQQRTPVAALLAAAGWRSIVCVRDLCGRDRCILAQAAEPNEGKSPR